MQRLKLLLAAGLIAALPGLASAQGANIAFGADSYDPEAPVEVSADSLSVDQSDGSAIFSGNVVAAQGELRLSASEIRIEYTDGDQREISRLIATGGVTVATGEEAAEAAEAVYAFDAQTITMSGEVLLTQGSTAISGDNLTIDLDTGTGVMEGRVRTILQPSSL